MSTTTTMSDGANMVEVCENILQGFYGQQTDEPTEQNSNESSGNIEASTAAQTQGFEDSDHNEFPIPPPGENLPPEDLGAETYADAAERIRTLAREVANQRTISRRYILNRQLRAIGVELRILADSFLPERHAGFLSLREAMLRKGGLSEEEKLVVDLIDSYIKEEKELPPTIISQICQHLRNCVTSITFRMTLQYLCYNSNSVPEELAAACDLASRIYPRFQDLERANSIYNALSEFIERSLDDVRH